jgi:hypothetical protein
MPAPPPDRSFWLDLKIDPDNPNLLTGLENWLELGLIDDRQIRDVAKLFLTCRLSEVNVDVAIPEFQSLSAEPKLPLPTPTKLRQPSVLSTMWMAFKDELSVRWLLFLGVFLVILSSGVLAATQWQRFPAWGQYGVLWAYTIAFWSVGFWARGRVGLSLTANTLQIVALLLIPVNFWAIDSFQLWHNPWEWLTTAVAVGSLSALAYVDARLRQQHVGLSRIAIVYLGLSFLQLGWQIPLWATLAVYLGAIGGVGVWQQRQQIFGDRLQWASLAIYSLALLLLRALFIVRLPAHNFGLAIGIVGWLVAQWGLQEWRQIDRIDALLARASAATVARTKYLAQRRATAAELANKYQTGAILLLLLGWLLAMSQWGSTFPLGSSWQPVAVDGLVLVWLAQRLQRRSNNGDLVWMFLVGLQTYGVSLAIAPDLIPLAKRDFWGYVLPIFGANALWAGTLIGMPYLYLWIGIAEWFGRCDRVKLARTAEVLVFGYGLLLNLLSLPNHLGLLLNLMLSTLGLIYLTHRGCVRTPLIYITHFYGLATIAVGLDYALPVLHANGAMWGNVATIGAIGEWLISTLPARSGSTRDRWYRSAWHFGLGLAGIAYLNYLSAYNSPWVGVWFLVPVTLTWLSYKRLPDLTIEIPRVLPWQVDRQMAAASLSVTSLILAQGLTIAHPDWRLLGSLVAGGLMFFNVRRLRTLPIAAIHIGFGLWAIAIGIERWIASSNWLVIGAIGCLGLWLAAARLRRLQGDLAPLYARSSDGWALSLGGVGVAISSVTYCSNYLPWQTASAWQWHHPSIAIASGILAFGLWYRDRLFAQAWTIWAIHWTLQLGLAELIHILGGNALTLAIVDIAIAFPILFAFLNNFPLGSEKCGLGVSPSGAPFQDRGARQDRMQSVRVGEGGMSTSNIVMLPWCYALLGMSLRLPYFNTYTGTLTIAAGIVSLIVGRKLVDGITYLGFIAIVLGCYELVTYQLSHAPAGGNIADALTIYGLVTAVLALGYRLSLAWWERQGKTTWLNLPLDRAKTIAHIHWLGASGWKIAAALIPLSQIPQLTPIHLATSVLLGIYAIVQGRERNQKGEWWVYVGIVEILGTGIYARSIFQSLGFFDEFIVLAACILGIAILLSPWQSWGWQDRPWRRIAVILPLLRVIFVAKQISLLNLLIIASFYAGVAKRQKQFGWVYASLFFLDWAAFRVLNLYHLQDPLWFVAIAGISLLLSVQFDPYFQQRERRQNRHLARLVGSGSIAITALVIHEHQPLVPAGISLLLTLVGIALSIRAFLYMGTITLMLTASYQLIILISEYSFTKWIVGLLAGVIIIAIAGNFERRREQIYTTVHHWLDRLQEWE